MSDDSAERPKVSKTFKCTICNRSFRVKHWLQVHKKRKHASKIPAASDAKPSPKVQSPAVDSEAQQEDQDRDSEESDEASDAENEEESDEENEQESDKESDEEPVAEPVKKPGESCTEKLHAELPPPPFKCSECDEAFHFTAALQEHQDLFAHGPMATREKKPETMTGPPAPRSKCENCDEAFHFAAMLLEHEKKVGHSPFPVPKTEPVDKPANESVAGPPPPRFKCRVCGEAFYFAVMRKEHERKARHVSPHHEKAGHGRWNRTKSKAGEPVRPPQHKCEECNEAFYYIDKLYDHQEKLGHGKWAAEKSKSVEKPTTEDKAERAIVLDNISEESLSYSDFQNFDNYDQDDMLDDLRQINSWSSERNTIHCMTCWKKFRTTSQIVEHVEMRECHSYINTRSIKWAVDMSDQSVVSRFYPSDGKLQCPHCGYSSLALSNLLFHAHGGQRATSSEILIQESK
ncbi:zinc finger domain protein [Fusarium sp. NRRL 52700]|nr:zinc finger domain protein [Fusarium sp. NRRL 52700]